MRRQEEARAAVAVCLRWGSYFALLADLSRPAASDIDNDQISQIDDDEMARMNIEISAALAWWLTRRGVDDGRYWNLVHRALAYLPCGLKTVSALERADILLVCTVPDLATQVRNSWSADRLDQALSAAETHGIRILANTITHLAWRNGPVEKVHAGRFEGYAFGNRRVPVQDEKAIIRQAQGGFCAGLKAADYLKYDDAWPPPAERVLPFMHGLVGPSGWSLTEESRTIEVALRKEADIA
jgi:hypothetical protein